MIYLEVSTKFFFLNELSKAFAFMRLTVAT